MNINKTFTFLKSQIDNFEYGQKADKTKITGKKALKRYLKETFKTNPNKDESYISNEVGNLYKVLENRTISDSDHFHFMNDSDIFYSILKALKITFEEVMEGEVIQDESYSDLRDDHKEIKETLSGLTEIVQLAYGTTQRSDIDVKQKEFSSLFFTINFFNEKMKALNAYEDHNNREKNEEAKQLATFLTFGIMNESAQIYPVSSIQNLLKDKLPLEFLMLQYLLTIQQSKKTELSKAIAMLNGDKGRKYYDKLAQKLTEEFKNKADYFNEYFPLSGDNLNLNYFIYSCDICFLDYLNRIATIYTSSFLKNTKYKYQRKLIENIKSSKDLKVNPILLSNVNDWLSFFAYNELERTSVKKNYDIQTSWINEFLNSFLKQCGSMLRQLSVYLEKIKIRNYTSQVVVEIRELLSEYISITVQVIFGSNYFITDELSKKIETFIEKLNHHTIIISHDMAGVKSDEED